MEQGYQQMSEEDTSLKAKAKRCCKSLTKVVVLGLLVVFFLAGVLQGALYQFASMKCKASKLQDYSYPGGGPKDLVADNTLLIEQDARWWGSAFIVQPADHVGLATGASTGVWYRTWGPFWFTYVYQDDLGMETFMVRDRPLALGGSHKMFRCDGTGPVYILNEGKHVVMNRIRSFFGSYTSRIYNIWQDGSLVAVSEKIGGTGQSHKQLIFRDPEKAEPFASAFLQDRHYHGQYDKWFIHDEKNITLPAWVINSATILMAFPTAQAKASHAPSQSLVEVPPMDAEASVMPSSPDAEEVSVTAATDDPEAAVPSKVVEVEEQVPAELIVPAEQHV